MIDRMNLLFTGASGFLGYNVLPLLKKKYSVETIGLTSQDDYIVNLAAEIPKLAGKYDVILHVAGKAHSLPKTEAEKRLFFDVNLQGICVLLWNKVAFRSHSFLLVLLLFMVVIRVRISRKNIL